MIDSVFPGATIPRSITNLQYTCGSIPLSRNNWRYPLLLAVLCITSSVLFVPERPYEMASICEKHHSEVVCRVW